MGSQTSHESSTVEMKRQSFGERKRRSFSQNNILISDSWISGISDSENSPKGYRIGFFEEEASISDVLKNIIKLSIPAFFGVLLRRATDTINYMAIGRLEDSDQINGAWFTIASVNFV